ncbi:MAG: hypothetical protein GY903_19090 [Fuerstiella sp.]|nr:hypothetical protein [Fuerstiella sp.]MCP4856591.1 hypothetical protein [Fuerstiella sp.]
MGERNFTKKKPGIKLTVTPVRRKLAVVVVLLTIGTLVFESEVLHVFSPDGSVEDGKQAADPFSDIESILAEFGDDEETPNAAGSESGGSSQLAAADESFPLLIPSDDTATEVPARTVSFPGQSSAKTTTGRAEYGRPQSTFPASETYGFHSDRSDHPPAATGIRFTGGIQPIQ